MGKGTRNRNYRYDSFADVKKKNKAKAQIVLPKWAKIAIASTVAALLVVVIVLTSLANNGVFKRGNILVKSPSGQFDVSEPMAAYFAFTQNYYSAYQYYTYYGSYLGLTSSYSSAASYAFLVARYACVETLRDSIDELADQLTEYVAGCEAALASPDYERLYKLTDEDMKDIDDACTALETLYTENQSDSSTYSYQDFNTFLKNAIGKGVNKKVIRQMSTITALYNKYYSGQVVANFDTVTEAQIAKEVLENAGEYYKLGYLSYTFADAEDDTVGTAFTGTTSEDFYKYVFEKAIFNDAYAVAFPDAGAAKRTADLEDAWNAYSGNLMNYKQSEVDAADLSTFAVANYNAETASVVDKYLNTLAEAKSNETSYGTVRFTEKVDDTTTKYVLMHVVGATTEGEGDDLKVTGYTYKTLELTNDEYLAFLDTLDSVTGELTKLGVTDGSDTSVNVESTDELVAWYSENTVTEEAEGVAYNREFTRVAGDKKVTFVADTGCTLTMITKAPEADLDKDDVAFGGYLKFDTEAEANAAFDTIKNQTGFELYYNFSNLKNGDTAATVSVTNEKGTDDNLDAFLFGTEKGAKVVANKAGDAWYVAFTFGAEANYARTIRMDKIADVVADAINKDGAIVVSEKALAKLGEPSTTTAE